MIKVTGMINISMSWVWVIGCFACAMLLTIYLSQRWIRMAHRMSWHKDVREDVPARHQLKVGTPSMGGLAFTCATVVVAGVAVAVAGKSTLSIRIGYVIALLATLMGFALLGALDDMRKGIYGRGLKARYKLLYQGLLALTLIGIARYVLGIGAEVTWTLPHLRFELGNAYLPLAVLLMVASTNAVNLTDGLDGLAGGLSVIALLVFIIIATLKGHFGTLLVCASLLGALCGFLVYNIHPAKLFMGDTGSLALGGTLCFIAILLKVELLWLLLGLVFFVDMLTVVIQVISYKTTRRRVFPITPIHHAFELAGWSEWRIVIVFWACGAAFAGITAGIALATM